MPTPKRVIAFDPGDVRTGWARAVLSENRISRLEHGVGPREETSIVFEHGWRMQTWGKGYDVVVCETWRPRRKNGSLDWLDGNDLLAARQIGHLELTAWMYGAELVFQEPSDKTAAVQSMPALLLDRKCGEIHEVDALTHLWLYAFRNHVTDPRQIVID